MAARLSFGVTTKNCALGDPAWYATSLAGVGPLRIVAALFFAPTFPSADSPEHLLPLRWSSPDPQVDGGTLLDSAAPHVPTLFAVCVFHEGRVYVGQLDPDRAQWSRFWRDFFDQATRDVADGELSLPVPSRRVFWDSSVRPRSVGVIVG